MEKNKIIIITGTGGILGTGHAQRMLNLAVRLNEDGVFSALIYLRQNTHPFPEKFRSLLTERIDHDAVLIIRDMRDSTIEEISLLQKTAPVLVIDDSGEGAKAADHSISLLPVPSGTAKEVRPDTSHFLYGYNFMEGISLLKENGPLLKDIDVAVYAGFDPSPELLSSIGRSIPASASSVLLAAGRAVRLTGPALDGDMSYAGVISRTKIIITHFGLTMFEAHACGCSIAALNPTPYHSALTETVRGEFDIIYSSEYRLFSPGTLGKIIEKELHGFTGKNISADQILTAITGQTGNFIGLIKEITGSRNHGN